MSMTLPPELRAACIALQAQAEVWLLANLNHPAVQEAFEYPDEPRLFAFYLPIGKGARLELRRRRRGELAHSHPIASFLLGEIP